MKTAINIIDAMCGMGKTSAAINHIKVALAFQKKRTALARDSPWVLFVTGRWCSIRYVACSTGVMSRYKSAPIGNKADIVCNES